MRLTNAGPDLPTIFGTLERRRQSHGVVLEQMRRIRDIYDGDVVIPLPELDQAEEPAVPNLIHNGLEQTSQRIASTTPDLKYPALQPGRRQSERRARTRRMANLAWWECNEIDLIMYRRARWLVGYGCAPAVILPDPHKGVPRWEIRDPLTAYPCPTANPDEITPPDVIFTFKRTWAWLREFYPAEVADLRTGYRTPADVPSHTLFDVAEYIDGEVRVLGVLGAAEGTAWGHTSMVQTGLAMKELCRIPVRIDMCPAVVPGRITLGRLHGQYDGATGMYHARARLMALETIAAERGVFPDTYLISRPGETADFVDGPHDGRTGRVNIVKGGDIRDQAINPGFAALQAIDRMERAERIAGGIPPDFGGESGSNIRTGRRGDAILSAVVDYPVQEAQRILAAALKHENMRAVATVRAYFGAQPKSFYVSYGKTPGPVDYIPDRDFAESAANVVAYAQAGSDANGLTVMAGQLVGLGMLSKKRGMEIHPMVADPEAEYGRVVAEQLEAALLASLQQQGAAGAIPPGDLARIAHLVQQEQYTLTDAVAKAQDEAQKRQASAGEPGTEEGPVAPGAPEAQPGLAQPGVGAEQPTVGPPPAGVENISQLFAALGGMAPAGAA